jgi:general secretion pathway protein A
MDGHEVVFTADAISRLHTLSGGVPRRLNQLADLALVAAAAGGQRQIDTATVDGVHHELSVCPSVAPAPA